MLTTVFRYKKFIGVQTTVRGLNVVTRVELSGNLLYIPFF